MFYLRTSDEFQDWLEQQDAHVERIIRARLNRLEATGSLGFSRHIDGPLVELKWKQGIRVYIARTGAKEYTILLGGTKHGQKKDILKAKSLLG
jgi:putative addiction module killer protein